MENSKRKLLAALVVVCCLVVLLLCGFVHSFRYPRIARTYYWSHPVELVVACARCSFPGTGIPSEEAKALAESLGVIEPEVNLVYLPGASDASGGYESTVGYRTRRVISKMPYRGSESLFWMIRGKVREGDNRKVELAAFEHRTGNLAWASSAVVPWEKEWYSDPVAVHFDWNKTPRPQPHPRPGN